MKIIGITAEYQPFHNGHQAQLQLARKMGDGVVVVLSGPFTQRGEPAFLDAWRRAACAIYEGADLVLQLPTAVTLRSAEDFAAAGITGLLGTGLISQVLAGAETPQAYNLFLDAAALRTEEPPHYQAVLRSGLEEGLAWSEASFLALEHSLALDPEDAQVLRRPNNLLAMAYAKALGPLAQKLVLHERLPDGASPGHALQVRGHDFQAKLQYSDRAGQGPRRVATASALRQVSHANPALPEVLQNLQPFVPSSSLRQIIQAQQAGSLLSPEALFQPAAGLLNAATFEALAQAFPEGLGRRLQKQLELVIRELPKLDRPYTTWIESSQTRRFPKNLIQRQILQALIDPESETFSTPARTPFLLVLGYSRQGRYLLRRMRKSAKVPILSRGSDLLSLPEELQPMVQTELRAQRLIRLLRQGKGPEFFTQVPQDIRQKKRIADSLRYIDVSRGPNALAEP